MDYKENRLGGGIFGLSFPIFNSAKTTDQGLTIDMTAVAGLGGYSTAIDRIYQMILSKTGGKFSVSVFNDPQVKQAIYTSLGLADHVLDTFTSFATYTQKLIASRDSLSTQINIDDAISQMIREYRDTIYPGSPLDISRIYSIYSSTPGYMGTGIGRMIYEGFIGDRISITPKGDAGSYFTNLSQERDPIRYLTMLAQWKAWNVHLDPLVWIEKDVTAIGEAVSGYPGIVPQAYKAIDYDLFYGGHAADYSTAVKRFESLLYAHFAADIGDVNNVAAQKDSRILQNVYEVMINQMMNFIQTAYGSFDISFRVSRPKGITAGGTTDNLYSMIQLMPIVTEYKSVSADGSDLIGTLTSRIPDGFSSYNTIGAEAPSPPQAQVAVNIGGTIVSPLDALIFYYLKTILLLKMQEVKLAGAVSKSLDPSSTYVVDAASNDPLKNWTLAYDKTVSTKTKQPTFVETAANMSKQFMTQQFGRQVVVTDPNAPTVKDYNNMESLRNFFARSVPVAEGQPQSLKELTDTGVPKKSNALLWLAGAAAAAAVVYYQYKG